MVKTDLLGDFNYSQSLEWLETNGLGGYASGTVAGANSRRYHGLLVAATKPPVGRVVMLSKLDETIVTGDGRFEIEANQYPGAVHPEGFKYLKAFAREMFPEFIYEAGGVRLKKTIAAIQGENTTVVLYEVVKASTDFILELLPLGSARDYHSLCHENTAIFTTCFFRDGLFQTRNYKDCPELFIAVPGATFEPAQHWYHNFEYREERSRGLDFLEDLYNHGKFVIPLKKGDKLGVIISTENPKGKDADKLYQKEYERRRGGVSNFSGNKSMERLFLAANQFVVTRDDFRTIIAGYHWFGDWGRDTMIALPGLCLATGRFDDAKKILQVFARSVSEGMLPNRFPESGPAEYNTLDATLWFFHAIFKYYQYTKDIQLIRILVPVLKDIIQWHDKGTRYNIHVANDGLLSGGEDGVQLTWMDAKVGNWVVTPRRGKAVEINALWHNALSVFSTLSEETGNLGDAADYQKRASAVKISFNKIFWNEQQACLYDYIDNDVRNDDLRPNQIYAVSLPFQLLPKEKAEKVFKTVTKSLLTPRGLRSLSPDHKDYKPMYEGDQLARDGAYHQGTVWSFLLGAYIDALINIKGGKGRVESSRILKIFFDHLDEAGVGTVSEIFDGDSPHRPRGCIAQAWSVGEVLRVALEHDLF